MLVITRLTLVAVVVALCHPVSAEILYEPIPLESIVPEGGGLFDVDDVNDRGDLIGRWRRPRELGGGIGPFAYIDMEFIDLRLLTGPGSRALDLNNAGQVMGTMGVKDDAQALFLYDDGAIKVLSVPGDPRASAFAMNDLGQIVGRARYGVGAPPFLYADGEITRLPTFGGSWGEAMDINNRGQIVGDAMASDNCHAFLYTDGVMHDIGALLPYDFSTALAVNEAGQVVGTYASSYSAGWYGFLYEDGRVIDLGHLGDRQYAVANDINDAGQVIGKADAPFLWSDGVMVDLNDLVDPALGLRLVTAEAINNRGQILCGDDDKSYLLTPVGEPHHTPTPAAAPLLAAGLAALLARRRRR